MSHLLKPIGLFISSVVLATSVEAAVLIEQTFESGSLNPWNSYSVNSNVNWKVDSYGSASYGYMNGYGADEASDDWLISPNVNFDAVRSETLTFKTAKNYDGGSFEVLVSTDYDGSSDPTSATWTSLSATYSTGDYSWTDSGTIDLSTITGSGYIAFRYISTGVAGGDGAIWEVDDIVLSGEGEIVLPLSASATISNTDVITGQSVTFSASTSGGKAPFSYYWTLGDGTTSTEQNISHSYSISGTYSISLSVTDNEGISSEDLLTDSVTVATAMNIAVPEKEATLRIASYNASLNRSNEGDLASDLAVTTTEQIKQVAQIIQHVKADVILINEFDFNNGSNAKLFIKNYLEKSINGSEAIEYPYYFIAPSNTGIDSGMDLNNDGQTGTADDGYGYGAFAGQYGMLLLSKYPIDTENVRTFQKFLWKDMPNALLPTDPSTGSDWYNTEETAIFRLSSKSHWDVPVTVKGESVHVLVSHPTPPVFDGDEDRNGKRNHDEIRLWADYITDGSYLYDDNSKTGGLGNNRRFVIMGDQNADPDEGDSYNVAINQLLNSALIDTSFTPESDGAANDTGDRDDTANWNMRADYVLPSTYGLKAVQSGHFWPTNNDVKYPLISASDHRLVWVDLNIETNATSNDSDDGVLPAYNLWTLLTMLATMGALGLFVRRHKMA